MKLVYKYLPPHDYALAFLVNRRLRVSQLAALNDPFECLSFYVRVDAKTLSEKMVACGKHDENWLQRTRANYPPLNATMPQATMIAARQCLNCQIGILSLSETWSSSKMWGYYAGQHAGFCVGLDADHSFFGGIGNSYEYGHLKKVTYSDIRHMCDLTKSEFPPQDTFFTKSKEWEHEEEVRAIYELKEDGTTEYDALAKRIYCKEIPLDAVKEVLVGCHANGGVMRACFQFAAKNGIPVFWCRPQLDNDTFKMTRVPLDPSEEQIERCCLAALADGE